MGHREPVSGVSGFGGVSVRMEWMESSLKKRNPVSSLDSKCHPCLMPCSPLCALLPLTLFLNPSDCGDILLIPDPALLPLLYSVCKTVLVGGSLLVDPSVVDPAGTPPLIGCEGLASPAVAGCAVLVGPYGGAVSAMAEDLNIAAVAAAEEAAAAVRNTGEEKNKYGRQDSLPGIPNFFSTLIPGNLESALSCRIMSRVLNPHGSVCCPSAHSPRRLHYGGREGPYARWRAHPSRWRRPPPDDGPLRTIFAKRFDDATLRPRGRVQ